MVGDVVLLFHFFGDWCVEEMWGGGHGLLFMFDCDFLGAFV